MKYIPLTVDEGLYLSCPIQPAGYDGDVNAIHFNITQPKKLAELSCRAELEIAGVKTFIPVTDKRFTLPEAVKGDIRLQLVYTDETGDVVSKTNVITLSIGGSVNALDPAAPGVPDALTQIQSKAHTGAAFDETTKEIVFTNMYDDEVGRVEVPITGGGEAVDVYRKSFTVADWFSHLTDYQFTVPAAAHSRGIRATVAEVLRSDTDYMEAVNVTSRRYTNGNIALISNRPFTGQISII